MKRVLPILAAALAVALALVASPALAQQPIGRDQHFIGLVNGRDRSSVVRTVCAGPTSTGRLGALASGQRLSVAEVLGAKGYTGPFPQVFAWFVPAAGHTPVQMTFLKYGHPKLVPSSVQVPCDGRGQVEFSSCPYLAPCAAGWVPTYVSVRFVDIAA
jgi:hypothetical protein